MVLEGFRCSGYRELSPNRCNTKTHTLYNLLSLHAGYTGVWEPKRPSPCLLSKQCIGPDGSAIFWKKSILNLKTKYAVSAVVSEVVVWWIV